MTRSGAPDAADGLDERATGPVTVRSVQLQYPGLTSHLNRRVANLSRDSVLVTLILLFGSHSECQ